MEWEASDVNQHLLRTLTREEWNEAIAAAREHVPGILIDLRWVRFVSMTYVGYDFGQTNLMHSNLSGCVFDACDFGSARMLQASLHSTAFKNCNLENVEFSVGALEGSAVIACTGYRAELRDVTEQVAQNFLIDQIADPYSEINAGRVALSDNGMRSEWRGSALHFWVMTEIEKRGSYCNEGACDCEVEHECDSASCHHCPCYEGDCECQANHDYDGGEYGTGRIYLATLVGKVEYMWRDGRGFVPRISMLDGTLHPHVSTELAICWGDAHMQESLCAADHLMTVMGWMCQHNPADEYRSIDDLPLAYIGASSQ